MTTTAGREGWKRLRIDVAPEVYEELRRMADEDGLTITDLLARGVATYRLARKAFHGWPDIELRFSKGKAR